MSTNFDFHARDGFIETQWDAAIKMLQLQGRTVATDEPLSVTVLPDGSHIETYETVPFLPDVEPLFTQLANKGLVS